MSKRAKKRKDQIKKSHQKKITHSYSEAGKEKPQKETVIISNNPEEPIIFEEQKSTASIKHDAFNPSTNQLALNGSKSDGQSPTENKQEKYRNRESKENKMNGKSEKKDSGEPSKNDFNIILNIINKYYQNGVIEAAMVLVTLCMVVATTYMAIYTKNLAESTQKMVEISSKVLMPNIDIKLKNPFNLYRSFKLKKIKNHTEEGIYFTYGELIRNENNDLLFQIKIVSEKIFLIPEMIKIDIEICCHYDDHSLYKSVPITREISFSGKEKKLTFRELIFEKINELNSGRSSDMRFHILGYYSIKSSIPKKYIGQIPLDYTM